MKLSEELKDNLKVVVDHFDKEDRAVRERQIREWKKLKLYWEGFSRVWWSDIAHDWRIWGEEENTNNSDASYYDKPVNVYKAYLESIIAALSITIPAVVCVPDNPEDPSDQLTARAGNHIAELIYKHNNINWLWLHALYIYCTEGLIACYNYTKEDKKFGTYQENKYEEQEGEAYVCAGCQAQLPDDLFSAQELDEFGPDDEDAALHDQLINKGQVLCPQCGAMLDPDLQKSPVIITKLVGVTQQPKSRQCLEVYGGLFVKVPNYALKQEDIPYLIFSYETHYANVIERYPEIRDNITKDGKNIDGGLYTPYERWGRLSTQYRSEYPINNITVKNAWLRPSAFNILDEDKAAELKKKFPDGCKVVLINDTVAEACNECLDDCWTLTRNPLADYLHHEPLGAFLVNIQDITNDLIALTLQTIEQGIPSTFADPAVMDFNAYRNSEATPGAMYPTKQQGQGKSIAEAFFTTKTATLGGEVMPFGDKVQQYGQLVSGAVPSIWGGQPAGGSDTASEYAMSKANAQQRLGITYKTMLWWWKQIFGKVIPAYMQDMTGDERLVRKEKNGRFTSVLIRQAETTGKIGDVELETSETMPITVDQKRDVIKNLLELNNPFILEALTTPENLPTIRDIIGINDFTMPGDNERDYEYEVIQKLLQSEPLDQMNPSIPVDPDLDNPQIGMEIDRNWLISPEGRQAKIDNPVGYMNVLLRMKQFAMLNMQNAMAAQANAASMNQPEKKSETDNAAPVKGQDDAQLPVH